MQALGFYITYAVLWVITLLPFRCYYVLSDILYFLLFYVFSYRKKVVFDNLTNAFPGKNKKEIKNIAKAFYRHFCDFVLESVKTIHISQKQNAKRFTFKNIEIFHELYKKNKNVVLVSGHYGNWEWMVSLPSKLEHKFLALYKPLRNKYFDKMIIKLRSKYATGMVAMNDTLKVILQHKMKKELIITWFLADQTPPKETRLWTTFLNQETPVFLGAEKIARKLNHAVVFMDIHKLRRGYYQAEFTLLFENAADTKEFEISKAHIKHLENTINKKPEYWLWSHRRWKHKRPEDIPLQ